MKDSLLTPDAIYELTSAFVEEFEIPGLAITIVSTDGWEMTRGFGVCELGHDAPVDASTMFAIASNSKAFLSACFAILVDEGRLTWDDPVVRHLPGFQLFDSCATDMITIRDVLAHRSGLPAGIGDLMQFPRTDHTLSEILRALRHFKPDRGLREGFSYSNCLYIVAGMILERISGESWEKFVSSHIFERLGMRDAVANPDLVADIENRAARHARLGPPAAGLGPLQQVAANESPLIGPSGGISASASSLSAWLRVQLHRGVLVDGSRLWSEARANDMWTPQSIVSQGPGPTPEMPHQSVMQGYALGWAVADYRGRRMLTHGGGLIGQSSRVAMLPEQGVGLAILSNSSDAEPVSGLRYAILDRLLGVMDYDWRASVRASMQQTESNVIEQVDLGDFVGPDGGPTLSLKRYHGRYRDPWYGDLLVNGHGSGLEVQFTRTAAMKSSLEPFGVDTFRTRFPRGIAEDAVLHFAVEAGAVTGITLRALSPLADVSFDYKDLNFSLLVDLHVG